MPGARSSIREYDNEQVMHPASVGDSPWCEERVPLASPWRGTTRMSLNGAEMGDLADITTAAHLSRPRESSTTGQTHGAVLHRYSPVTPHYGQRSRRRSQADTRHVIPHERREAPCHPARAKRVWVPSGRSTVLDELL